MCKTGVCGMKLWLLVTYVGPEFISPGGCINFFALSRHNLSYFDGIEIWMWFLDLGFDGLPWPAGPTLSHRLKATIPIR